MQHSTTPPSDLEEFVAALRALPSHSNESLRQLFGPGTPIFIARAPGRLDVMGGIGDYSGSLVLEMPIAEAAFAAIQPSAEPGIQVMSASVNSEGDVRHVRLVGNVWSQLLQSDYGTARDTLRRNPQFAWAAYVIGPVLVLLHETGARLDGGLRILIDSHVPEAKGVSSSAALEVATMRAAAALLDRHLPGEEIARLCQVAENQVVGAPCGIMDQMTAALGREGQLLALLCQPAVVEGYVPVPAGAAFWGIDSGIRHAVSGSDYTSVRTGAFMGYRILTEAVGLHAKPARGAEGVVDIDDPTWHGFLANVTPADFHNRFSEAVPEEMSGHDFLARFGGITDRVTRVDPDRHYAVRQPTLHPIGENARTHQFRGILEDGIDDRALAKLGELMLAAHQSYSACGLGSDGTDLLVELVHEAGPRRGLYGAKITGGGSGGTVAVLGRHDAGESVAEVARRYTERCGRPTQIFRGSSPGACATDVQQITI